ncbi:hypothetical protein GCM10011390_34900 [Aureimonas endophytica]|uniref:TfuA-like core domain-containing protein n=1 Tax=Aureimonas endophytica TaxID=2027858 RepID=A0A916ZT78_9HYPH|nr:TfuA-like protein [Aureimonas endophytica]GGE12735.1 hypothetical protein GCM10011390_34900 [Aureimonas endophytica]
MKVLFVGPSLHGQRAELRRCHPDLDLRGPAARGDIVAAVEDGATAIGLVDGCFGDVPAVWHKEILYALAGRVAVGGGASMGALRAAECGSFGMVGLGTLFQDYASGRLMDDEAVAVAHGPAELDFMPLSVPWVNFEATVLNAKATGRLARREAELLILAGRHLHFSERTFRAATALCSGLADARKAVIRQELAAGLVDRKRQDAWQVIDWLATISAPGRAPSWQLARTSHFLALQEDRPSPP